jgi:integrase
MATLYIRKGSPFVWIGYSLGGVQVARSTRIRWVKKRNGTPAIPREAEEFKRHLEARILTRDFEPLRRRSRRVTLEEALEHYLTIKGPKLAESTKKMYKLSLEKAKHYLGDSDLNRVTEKTMLVLREHFIEDDGETNAAIWLRHLAAILNMAKRKKLIPENPITPDVKFRPTEQPVTCYTDIQLGNLLQTADALKLEGLSDQLLFLVYSGFRSMESCLVKWDQVDFKRGVVRYWNHKGKRWEDQPMDREFAEFVGRLPRKYTPYILRYRHKAGLNHALKRINRLLEHPEWLNVHTLKTCAVGRWKSMGLDMLTISKLAHHRSVETTRKHYDYFDTEKIVGRMNLGLTIADRNAQPNTNAGITTNSLQSKK